MNLLSLVMITRDEAEVLPGFLARHQDLADEIVVIDTGSRDETPVIAEQAGCVTGEHPWSDDFAAARNTGLGLARGDWVLIMDADEVIAPGDQSRLRQRLAAAGPNVFLQPTINYCPTGSHLEWQPVFGAYPAQETGQEGFFLARRAGLFPRREGLVFSGRVHETILPAAAAAGLEVVDLGVPVHHYGYVRSLQVNNARRVRYRRLLELKYADDPLDWSAQLEWATALLEDGESDRALPLLSELAAGPGGLRPVVRGMYLLGRIRREQGDTDAAIELLTGATVQDPGFLFAWLELVRTRTQQGQLTTAIRDLELAQQHCGSSSPLLQMEELRLLIKTGRLQPALDLATAMAAASPQWRDLVVLQKRLVGLA